MRAEAKMTQQELAERSDVHRQTIAQLATGVRRPTEDTVQLLARALGVDCTAVVDPPLQPPAEAAPK